MKALIFFIAFITTSLNAVTWANPTTVEEGGANPVIVMDSSGNALAAWVDLAYHIVKIATLPYGGSWSTPITISGSSPSTTYSVWAAMNASGYAVIAWQGPGNNIEAVTYQFGAAPSAPLVVYSGQIATNSLDVAIDGSGNAVLVFVNSPQFTAYGISLPFGAGSWSGLTVLSGSTYSETGGPAISMNSSGRAVAMWNAASSPFATAIQSASYSGGTWTSTNVTVMASTQSLFGTVVAVDNSGNAIALWNVGGGTYYVQGATLPFGGSWSSPTPTFPYVAADNNTISLQVGSTGNAVATWIYQQSQVVAMTYSGGTWSTPQLISGVGSNLYASPIAIATNGDAFTIWPLETPRINMIQSSRLPEGSSTWLGPSTIQTSIDDLLVYPQIAAYLPTYAVGIWNLIHLESDYFVEASIGISPVDPVLNISSVSGNQVLHKFPAQGDLINQLFWTHPVQSKILKYQIFRNTLSNLIGETTNLHYPDHDRPPGVYTTYYIVPINEAGEAGQAASTVVAPL